MTIEGGQASQPRAVDTRQGGHIFTDTAGAEPTTEAQDRQVPRCVRRTDGKVLGGVAAGLADHLQLPLIYVRLAFIALTAAGGFGVILYAALWIFLPQESVVAGVGKPVGVDAATRRGFRREGPRRRRREDAGQLVAIGVLGIGVILLFQQLGGLSAQVFWPIIVGGVGLALLWRQADESQRARWSSAAPPRHRWLWPLVGAGGWVTLIRSAIGIGLVVACATWVVASSGGMNDLTRALVAVLVGLVGLGLIVGPWVWRLTGDLSAERRERIRTQERADMAAHLHDSVLQTLALIQKQAPDERAVRRLARAQERDLRDWLFGAGDPAEATLKSALTKAAAEVEDNHGVPVEVVSVGDIPLDDPLTALVRAAGEAMVNAAKHSGAPRIDVYAEVVPDRVEVFVRDRGVGFDPDQVSDDRLGVRRSIYERMERHGGKADIRSAPGEGTEVKLVVDRGGSAGDNGRGQ